MKRKHDKKKSKTANKRVWEVLKTSILVSEQEEDHLLVGGQKEIA